MQYTVKYAPKNSKELVGNKTNYAKLINWIRSYQKYLRSGKSFKRIALMGGLPGIGKTSGVQAIALELNYEIIEFNASDQRNADVISRLVGRASRTKHNIGYDGKIVLIDEVDGIAGNEDRGGLSALLNIAKQARHPIVCTANDYSKLNLRSLKRDSLFLGMKPPSKGEITNLLQRIANNENIKVDPIVFRAISENARGDIRAAINDLENLGQNRSEIPRQAIRALSVRDSESSIDVALRLIFGEARTLKQAHDITSNLDVDYSMFLNYMVENIPSHASTSNELVGMFKNAALADLNRTRIIFTQNWRLLKYFYFFLSAGIHCEKKSPYQSIRTKFPSLLISLSKSRKNRNLRKIIASKIGAISHSSQSKVIDSVLPYLRLEFETLFNLYQKDDQINPQHQKLEKKIAFLHYQAQFTPDEFHFLFNDPLFDTPTKAVEKKQKELIKHLNNQAEVIQIEQGQFVNKTFWEDNQLAKHFKSDVLTSKETSQTTEPIEIKTKAGTKKSIKKDKKKRVKKKKASSLLDFTEKKSKESKESKKLLDFM
ncbi:MAG: replication factor C large subunit [Candidatus Hodarchaeales archaeon]